MYILGSERLLDVSIILFHISIDKYRYVSSVFSNFGEGIMARVCSKARADGRGGGGVKCIALQNMSKEANKIIVDEPSTHFIRQIILRYYTTQSLNFTFFNAFFFCGQSCAGTEYTRFRRNNGCQGKHCCAQCVLIHNQMSNNLILHCKG